MLNITIDEEGYAVHDGLWRLHHTSKCQGHPCPFHAPSDHHMVKWPMVLRNSMLIERICEHGCGHPDPDSLAYMETIHPGLGVHGCDGCCKATPVAYPEMPV